MNINFGGVEIALLGGDRVMPYVLKRRDLNRHRGTTPKRRLK